MTKTEMDVVVKKVIPFLQSAGWDLDSEIFLEVTLTEGTITRKSGKFIRGKKKRADIVLYTKVDIPIAVIEVKEAGKPVESGIQQAIRYADMLDVPFMFSTNGHEILFRNNLKDGDIENYITPNNFPSKEELTDALLKSKSMNENSLIFKEPYFKNYKPRYYQQVAINRTLESISKGLKRIMLVMATGTGKTFTAFQIVWKFIKGNPNGRVLYLADRNILIDQTLVNDFSPLKKVATKITNRKIDKSYQVYFSLYQAISGKDEKDNIFKEFSPEFFDLIIIDECHRGSAKDDSSWREILDYFNTSIHIGMTATPKETKEVSNLDYFNEPIYSYSLKQGITDGFLAPYRVVRVNFDKDLYGLDVSDRLTDDKGIALEKKIFSQKDIDKDLVLNKRTDAVATKIFEQINFIGKDSKTIVFCQDQDHALRLRTSIVNCLSRNGINEPNYCMRITSDDIEGKSMLEDFINPDKKIPVIVTTSKLLTTGVDSKLVKLIVIDQNIQSKSEFKQIIGRGTRVDEERGKMNFTILDFKGATTIFSDNDFDGYPEQIIEDSSGDGYEKSAEEVEKESAKKYFFDGIEVTLESEKIQYLDENGNLISKSIIEFSKDNTINTCLNIEDFHNSWINSNPQENIEQHLLERGVMLDELEQIFGDQYSAFDLICHVAYDAALISRSTRAMNCKKYLRDKYENNLNEICIDVLNELIEKFRTHEEDVMDTKILLLSDFRKYGSAAQIINNFDGRERYLEITQDLKNNLFSINI